MSRDLGGRGRFLIQRLVRALMIELVARLLMQSRAVHAQMPRIGGVTQSGNPLFSRSEEVPSLYSEHPDLDDLDQLRIIS